jgi:hypothetical protein
MCAPAISNYEAKERHDLEAATALFADNLVKFFHALFLYLSSGSSSSLTCQAI